MSSFSSSSWDTTTSSGSLFPSMSSIFLRPIPDEDFMMFHEIHRQLFSLLLFNLCRDANQSMLVMAFWMWLDVEAYCSPTRLVNKLLNNLSPPEVSLVADETLICLRCIQDEHFMFSGSDEEISNLQNLMEAKRLRLRFLRENRVRILSNVMTLLGEVCWRAFKDILQTTFGDSFAFNPNDGSSSNSTSTSTGISNFMPPPVIVEQSYPSTFFPQLGFLDMPHFAPNDGLLRHVNRMGMQNFGRNEGVGHEMSGMGRPNFVPNFGVHRLGAMGEPNRMVVPSHIVGFAQQRENIGFNAQDQLREFRNRETELMMSHARISEPRGAQVPADDRTLFLTFSKGYPIPEDEIRNFFTRAFGDFIEAIYMQEVRPKEQALYARIVARRPSDISRIVRGTNEKIKFTINGRHVCVRKFVRNNTPRTPGRGGPVR